MGLSRHWRDPSRTPFNSISQRQPHKPTRTGWTIVSHRLLFLVEDSIHRYRSGRDRGDSFRCCLPLPRSPRLSPLDSLELIDPHERLRELGLKLPAPPAPLASYVPTVLVPIGNGRSLLYIAGQVSVQDGKRLIGRCPDEVSVEEAQAAARACALNLLAQMEAAAGLANVERVVQVTGFVLSTGDFGDQPKVLNGASDLLVEVLGDAGRHTRLALGTNALPFSVTVEIAAVAVVRAG